MKKFVSPEIEIHVLDLTDVLTDSAEGPVPSSTAAPVTTVADAGLDNEVSAKDLWEF